MKLEDVLLDHAQATCWSDLPSSAVQAAITFITDSLGVAVAGSMHPRLAQVTTAAQSWGQIVSSNTPPECSAAYGARQWHNGQLWPAPSAAMLNAYQIHNQEFDCVHEQAVVHAMAAILPALVAQAERLSQAGTPVTGQALIASLVLAVDVACTIGIAQIAPMRFFRPAMCGALGAVIGLAKLSGCSRAQTADALGIAYSQLAGTMQAHTEGSPMLALQVGLASRTAVVSLDLALAGFSGPKDVLEGPFGYYELFDAPLAPRRAQVQDVFAQLGHVWRISELSHKPFPTGRAGHGALDGLGVLMQQHGLTASEVQSVELAAPPLIVRLVGRPATAEMDVNYARLCLPYLVATYLLEQRVNLDDFSAKSLRDPVRLALAQKVRTVPNDCTDPNALSPQSLLVRTNDHRNLRIDLPAVLGHPLRPLSAAAQRAKFDACCAHAGMSLAHAQSLHASCCALAQVDDVRDWVRLMLEPVVST